MVHFMVKEETKISKVMDKVRLTWEEVTVMSNEMEAATNACPLLYIDDDEPNSNTLTPNQLIYVRLFG